MGRTPDNNPGNPPFYNQPRDYNGHGSLPEFNPSEFGDPMPSPELVETPMEVAVKVATGEVREEGGTKETVVFQKPGIEVEIRGSERVIKFTNGGINIRTQHFPL